MPHKTELSPTPVAVFNSRYVLTAIFGSIKELSKATGVVRQSIIKAVYGDTISVKGYYLRAIPNEIVLDMDDIGTLNMFAFDKAAGNPDRKIYGGSKMRKRLDIIMESQHKKYNN